MAFHVKEYSFIAFTKNINIFKGLRDFFPEPSGIPGGISILKNSLIDAF